MTDRPPTLEECWVRLDRARVEYARLLARVGKAEYEAARHSIIIEQARRYLMGECPEQPIDHPFLKVVEDTVGAAAASDTNRLQAALRLELLRRILPALTDGCAEQELGRLLDAIRSEVERSKEK